MGMAVRPEALILDIGMPGLTGYETARLIRQEVWGRSAVLIAVTGWGQEQDKDRAAEAGFDVHMTKPVDSSKLEATLAIYLREREKGVRRALPS